MIGEPSVMRIHHVAFAHSEEVAPQNRLAELLDIGVCHTEDVDGFVERMIPAGDGFVQMLESTGPGVVEQFLEKRGNALHHVAFEADDLDAFLANLRSREVRLIDDTARPGGMGTRIAFIHPEEFGGLLIELVQVPGDAA